MMIMKFRSMKLSRSFSKLRCGKANDSTTRSKTNSVSLQSYGGTMGGEVKWELRPGGMLVQKREMVDESVDEEVMVVRVATGSKWHDISFQPTSFFGELKMILSMVTSLEPKEQRLLFKGKEREDGEYLHMVGVSVDVTRSGHQGKKSTRHSERKGCSLSYNYCINHGAYSLPVAI